MVQIRNSSRRGIGARMLVGALAASFFFLAAADLASAETRKLKVKFVHTGEKAEIVFKKNGQYVQVGLNQLNKILRDFRRNEPTKMDPRLLDLVWEVYQQSGSRDYIHVISGYRSPATNGMLRSRGRGVAKNSQHTLGKAMDFFLPDVKLSKLREIGLKMGVGGVGFYPTSGSPFVHLDTGKVRHWPRMSRQELARIFPDGKTLHIGTDGKLLPRYEQALAEYKSKGRTSSVAVASTEETKKPNFFQLLAQRAKQDQDDDEGAVEAVPGVYAGNSKRPAELRAAPAEDVGEAPVETAAPQPEAVPAPAPKPEPEAQPVEVAALKPENDLLSPERVPLPLRRPAFKPAVAEKPAPEVAPAAEQPVQVAALTPQEIEEIRRIAVPAQAELADGVALPAGASPAIPTGRAPRPTAEVPGSALPPVAPVEPQPRATTLALLPDAAAPQREDAAAPAMTAAEMLAKGLPLPAPAPRARTASAPATAAPAAVEAAPPAIAPAPAVRAPKGASAKTIELALAATPDTGSEASRAIRDLIASAERGRGEQVPGSLTASFAAVTETDAPMPIRNPRKAGAGTQVASLDQGEGKVRVAKVAKEKAAADKKAGRFALAGGAQLQKAAEISAPGFSVMPALDADTRKVAGFIQSKLSAGFKFDAD